MTTPEVKSIDKEKIKDILNDKKGKMKLSLFVCAHCGLCAESCPLYRAHDRNPEYMPSYKVINSLGKLYKKIKKLDRNFLEEIKELIWKNCVLCGRCYCPLGIDIPSMIALARGVCRSQGISGVYPHSLGAPEEDFPEALSHIGVSEKE